SNNGCGEVGGVEKISSTGSKFMANGEDCLDGCDGSGGGEVKGGRVDFEVLKISQGEIPSETMGERGGGMMGLGRGPVWKLWCFKFENSGLNCSTMQTVLLIPCEAWTRPSVMKGTGFFRTVENFLFQCQSPLKVSHRPTPNELANDGVNLSKHEINVGFINSLPEKWLTFSQGLRNANHTHTLDLADIYGMFVYEDNLIQRSVIQDFQENSDDEVDERSSEEYLRDLDIEYHKRALLANSKLNNYSSVSKGFQPKFTIKLIHSSSNTNNQVDSKFQKDYKTEYKKMKAKLVLLEASPSSSQNPKTFQPKNKGLVAETFDWDEEEVSNKDEVTHVKVLMALADDELTVEKNHARNGSFTKLKGNAIDFLTPLSKERPGLGIMKHTKPETQDSSNKSVLGTVIVSETKQITPLVPTEVKDTKQE
nr:hypothetical protein [Tanacetum cinerariifolium]